MCIHAVSPISAQSVLEEFEDDFFDSVSPRCKLLTLKRKKVITPDIERRINVTSDDDDAKEILFDHLKNHSSLDTLSEYCKVAANADGFPKQQRLAKAMIQKLQEKGWLNASVSLRSPSIKCTFGEKELDQTILGLLVNFLYIQSCE